jgi:hypothetical protein
MTLGSWDGITGIYIPYTAGGLTISSGTQFRTSAGYVWVGDVPANVTSIKFGSWNTSFSTSQLKYSEGTVEIQTIYRGGWLSAPHTIWWTMRTASASTQQGSASCWGCQPVGWGTVAGPNNTYSGC